MKLTCHQKEIVKKIIEGEVYDIPSYLRIFGKGCEQQYDSTAINDIFIEMEEGRTYFFREKGSYYYTDVYDNRGTKIQTFPVPNTMTYEFKDYPLSAPIKAEITMKIKPEIVRYEGEEYSFDFLQNKYFVAKVFEDIIDFIALWSYLIREGLIIEFNKPIDENDLSIFFEKRKQQINKDSNPYWKRTVIMDTEKNEGVIPKIHYNFVPSKSAENYITEAWKFNEDHLTMCKEFIGKKIVATSSLKNYRQNRYRTFEEVSQSNNLFIAWLAFGISVISVVMGNCC